AKMLASPTLNENGSYSKILVIDDDETIRVMLEYFLAGAGFKVLQSNTGQAAFEAILDQPDIAAIIIDHYMPNMTGLQFVRMMKRLQLLPNAALIMMTGNSEAKFIKEVAKSGVSALLVKPFDKERLFTVLQKSGVSLPLNSKSAA
ncbi:MAG: response regulator, partial [Bdellovibrionota bacterium]